MQSWTWAGCVALACLASAARAQGDCDFDQIKVQGDTAAACEASAKTYLDEKRFGDCALGDFWMSAVSGAQAQCLKKIQDKTLDARLLPLKAKDKKEFAAEMRLQKLWNEAVQEQCARYAACDGTMYRVMANQCPIPFTEYRTHQAEATNAFKLSLKEGKPTSAWPVKFREFAKALCALPAELWADKKAPARCEERALFDLEKALGPLPKDVCES